MRLESCSTCRYYIPGGVHNTDKDGTCRWTVPQQWQADGPPVESTEVDTDSFSGVTTYLSVGVTSWVGWPDVLGSDWCGEYTPFPERNE